MAVVSIKEIADGKSGQSTGVENSSIVRVFRVTTNSQFDTPLEIQPALPIDWGTALAANDAFLCRAVDYDLTEWGRGLSVWVVTFTFRTATIDQERLERQQFPNPLDRRCRCSVSAIRYGELSVTDKNGDVKRNSAGDIYDAREKDATRYAINLHKNYTTIPSWVWDLQDKLNTDPVTIRGRTCAAETLKFSLDRVPEIQVENGHKHFPISWTLDYRREGWKDKRVDAGIHYLDGTDLKRIMVQDADGNDVPAEIEQWLDGSGGLLRTTIPNPQPGDETINEFDDYESGDYSVMPLSEVASANAEA